MGDFSIFKICGWAIYAGGWAFAHLGNMLKVALSHMHFAHAGSQLSVSLTHLYAINVLKWKHITHGPIGTYAFRTCGKPTDLFRSYTCIQSMCLKENTWLFIETYSVVAEGLIIPMYYKTKKPKCLCSCLFIFNNLQSKTNCIPTH